MRNLINLPFSVNVWNAVKFLLLEFVVSLVIAPLWTRYVRCMCHRMVEVEDSEVTIFSSEIGRATPASIMVYRTGATVSVGSRQVNMKPISRVALVLVNVFLLGSLLATEYGSGSRGSFKSISANVTDIQRHKALVSAVARNEMPVSALTPLYLVPQDYSYVDDQSSILLKRRVRSLQDVSEVVQVRSADVQSRSVSICGISTTARKCNHLFDGPKHVNASTELNDQPKLFIVGKVTKVGAKFRGDSKEFYFAKGLREIGQGRTIYPEPRSYTLDCIVKHAYLTRSNYMTYEPTFCVSAAGNFDLFFSLKKYHGALVDAVLDINPILKNKSKGHIAVTRIYHKTMFGIERSSVYSRDVALYQLLRMDMNLLNEDLNSLGQSENIFLEHFKERMLWALLGMVSGNSAIESVDKETGVELATLNALFVTGSVGIFVAVFLLLIFGSYSGPRNVPMPVDTGDMLQISRVADCKRRGCTTCAVGDWPELCITCVSDNEGRVSFSGGEPMLYEQFSVVRM